jgi:micrococcal nuclease
MRSLLIAIIVAVGYLTSALANPYYWKVNRVIDGDTIIVEAPWLPSELGKTISIRIAGIDTPEKGARAQCEREAILGAEATALTKSLIKPGDVVRVDIESRDKYFRIVGTISVNGTPLQTILLNRGLARRYDGGTKSSWCE